MSKIIINADDFGKSSDINETIIYSMKIGLCKDTTLLVNFENSKQAAEMALAANLSKNVGIHLNLTEGRPVSNSIIKEKRFCDENGFFHYKRNKRMIYLTPSEKNAVFEELISQIQLCRSFGIPISHADSHNHIHEEPGLAFIFFNILKREKIPFLRLTNNLAKNNLLKKSYRDLYNIILAQRKLKGSDYFGSIYDFLYSEKLIPKTSIVELMIHPGMIINDTEVFDVYSKDSLNQTIKMILENNELITYNNLLFFSK